MLDLKLVLVEDDIDLLNKLGRILKREVSDLKLFSSAFDALIHVQKEKPDVIISDIKMSNMNGLEMVDKIRTLYPDVPVIIASAFNDTEFFQKAIKLKVENFVIKPIDIDKLLGDLKEIKNKQIIQEGYLSRGKLLEEYKDIVDRSNYISKTNLKGQIIYVNDKFENLTGYKLEDIKGKSHSIMRHPEMRKSFYERLWKTILNKGTWHGVIKNYSKSGEVFYVETTISPILDKDDNIVEFISISNNITQLVQNKKELQKQLITDRLTKIYNRLKLKNDLLNASESTLILINVDNFKDINNLFGLYFGDQVLIYIANLLKEISTKYICNCYRISADEFMLLFDKDISIEEIELVINEIEKILKAEIFSHEEITFDIDLSYGVVQNNFSRDKNMLLSMAEIAMHTARKEHKLFDIYSRDNNLRKNYEHNFKWNKKLKLALEENRIDVFFQPIVNVKDNNIIKYESLVRYIEIDGSIIGPNDFLDVAKRSKIYHKITQKVIEISSNVFKDRHETFSINFSIEDLLNEDTIDYLLNKVNEYKLNNRVIVEILESEGIDNYIAVIDIIEKLKMNGIRIAIDDFGSGYSNFSYLISLDIDILKIDGSLIKDIDTNKSGQSIVKSIINFTKELGIKTVAEFVCSKEIYDLLKEMDIDYFQGYYISKPLSIEQLKNWKKDV
ncbi:EAL domain-containing protein [bacterium]|nr:EAL domain-containing protein [bacterium]